MSWCIAFLLAVGLLASFTALSTSLGEISPGMLRLTGPINPLKVGAPLLAVYFWLGRDAIPQPLRRALFGIFVLGLAATVGAGLGCSPLPGASIREFAAMTIGTLAAACFLALPSFQQRAVVVAWGAMLAGLAGLDLLAPSAIDWLYTHVFDPNTRWFDNQTASVRLLTGVFGFQSFAKLLSWVPWLCLAFLPAVREKPRLFYFWVSGSALATGLILSTTQRGPLLGMLLGWCAFFLHAHFRAGRRKLLIPLALAAVITGLVTIGITPREIWQGRVEAAVSSSEPSTQGAVNASRNISFRRIMWGISLDSVSKHPLGDACIPEQTFTNRGVYSTHSHNLFLHQFRERGWLWGLVHLALWVIALFFAWKGRSSKASALFAGLTCILSQGMFDHPWFVLNHAMLLSLFLLASYLISFSAPPRQGPAV
jgi:hypothetical protein